MATAGQYERLELDIDWDSHSKETRISGVHWRIQVTRPAPALPSAASPVRNAKREPVLELDEGWDDATDDGWDDAANDG